MPRGLGPGGATAEEVPEEDEPFVDCTAEELAWMDEPMEEAPSDPEGEELLEAIQWQYSNCPTEPPRGDCRVMQWWFRWLRQFTGPPPPSRWAAAELQMRRLGH